MARFQMARAPTMTFAYRKLFTYFGKADKMSKGGLLLCRPQERSFKGYSKYILKTPSARRLMSILTKHTLSPPIVVVYNAQTKIYIGQLMSS